MAKKSKKSVASKKKVPSIKYRITTICGKVGGPVTAENVELAFNCPNCGVSLKVSDNFKKLESDAAPGHRLRSVKEVSNAPTGLS